MKTAVKRIMVIALLLSVFGGTLPASGPAFAKSVSKVTKIVTLTSKKNSVIHKLSIRPSGMVTAKVKFLEVKGKVSGSNNELYLGGYEGDDGKGSFFSEYSKPKLSKKSFRKGKTLKLKSPWKNYEYISGKGEVDWTIPDKGITRLKMKITYYTKGGRKSIKSIKEQ